MRILVIGSGAREHAIVTRLLADNTPHTVIVAPGNAGIAADVATVPVDAESQDAVVALAREVGPNLVVVGPEAPLVAGVAEAVRAAGYPVFGPDQAAAALEGSKTFAKDVMSAAGVPTGGAVFARDINTVRDAMDRFGAPYVIKADGLAAGKGVIVTGDAQAALDHAATYLDSGVLVEEFLSGPEVSLFFLSDGVTVAPLTPAQDFKRAYDGDLGPNTGGMGAYTPLPWLPHGFVDDVREHIAQPTIDQLRTQGTPFVGLLYCGLIITPTGTKVIEFNARFGDPETQVVLTRLNGEFGTLLHAAATGHLDAVEQPTFSDDVAITVVVASEGYPEHPITGRPISGLDRARAVPGVHIDHAATAHATTIDNTSDPADNLIATGGRVLSVVARGTTFAEARAAAYEAIGHIHLAGSHHRTDIAAKVVDA